MDTLPNTKKCFPLHPNKIKNIIKLPIRTKSRLPFPLFFAFCIIEMSGTCFAQSIKIKNDIPDKKIFFGNKKIKMIFDYDQKANISSLIVNGQKVIEGPAGIY